jgi:hypothetical protein
MKTIEIAPSSCGHETDGALHLAEVPKICRHEMVSRALAGFPGDFLHSRSLETSN